jgi:hypothetical protein
MGQQLASGRLTEEIVHHPAQNPFPQLAVNDASFAHHGGGGDWRIKRLISDFRSRNEGCRFPTAFYFALSFREKRKRERIAGRGLDS